MVFEWWEEKWAECEECGKKSRSIMGTDSSECVGCAKDARERAERKAERVRRSEEKA